MISGMLESIQSEHEADWLERCMSKRQKMSEGGDGGGGAAAVQAHGTSGFSINLEQHKRVLTEVFVHVSEE